MIIEGYAWVRRLYRRLSFNQVSSLMHHGMYGLRMYLLNRISMYIGYQNQPICISILLSMGTDKLSMLKPSTE